MQSIRYGVVGLVTVASAVILLTPPASAHDTSSPGFQAAWVEVQRDGGLHYNCLVDLRNCDAGRLDLVVQFRWAQNDDNILERETGKALMLFPDSWQRPAGDGADWRWRPEPVEIPATLWEKADLEPGTYDIDAIFDLYDPEAEKYVAGGWAWRATLRVVIDSSGKASVAAFMPHDVLPLARDSQQETYPTVVVYEAPSREPVPAELAEFGLKPTQLLGTTRLRHGSDVARVALTQDGDWIVSASESEDDQFVSVWDARSGALQQRLEGRLLAGEDGTVLILTTQDGLAVLAPGASEPLCRISEPPQAILAAGLSADGKSLVLVDAKSVGCWDLASGRPVSVSNISVNNPEYAELTASLSRCSRFAALAYNSGKINSVTVFEAGSGRKLFSTIIDYGIAPPLTVCDGGKRLALPDPMRFGKHHLAVYEVASGKRLFDFESANQKTPLAVGKDGSVLALVDGDCLVFLDPVTGQAQRMTQLGEDVLRLEFSPDGNSLALTGHQGTRVIAAATGETLVYRRESSKMAVFSPDGARLVAVGSAGQMIVWNPKTGEIQLEAIGLADPVSQLALSSDGKRLAAVSDSAECRVWDTSTGDTLLSLRSPCLAERGAAHVALSPDGSTVITSATLGGDPLGWNIDQKRIAFVLSEGGVGAGPVIFSPNGRSAVACHYAGDESALTAWDVATGDSVFRDQFLAVGAEFILGGSELLAADGNAIVRRYDWLQKQNVDEFRLTEPPRRMSCSSDGRLIAFNDYLLRTSGGELLAKLEVLGTVDAICLFTPDSRRLLAVAEGKLYVFDTSNGQHLKTVSGPWKITSAAVAADGKKLWTGLATGAIVCWDWAE